MSQPGIGFHLDVSKDPFVRVNLEEDEEESEDSDENQESKENSEKTDEKPDQTDENTIQDDSKDVSEVPMVLKLNKKFIKRIRIEN